MTDLSTTTYRQILDRLGSADPAVHQAAVNDLIERAYDRLRRLAAKIMRESFPRAADRHEVESVLNVLYAKLVTAFRAETVRPATPAEFLTLAAHKIRQTLLDLVESDRRRDRVGAFPVGDGSESGRAFDPGTSTLDPAKTEMWRELHARVHDLPADVRAVFELHFYLELSQAEIAEVLGKTPKQVSRLWLDAAGRLAAHLPA
jgi:RNA polymerase sigma factor (sigma-70 family)